MVQQTDSGAALANAAQTIRTTRNEIARQRKRAEYVSRRLRECSEDQRDEPVRHTYAYWMLRHMGWDVTRRCWNEGKPPTECKIWIWWMETLDGKKRSFLLRTFGGSKIDDETKQAVDPDLKPGAAVSISGGPMQGIGDINASDERPRIVACHGATFTVSVPFFAGRMDEVQIHGRYLELVA